MIVAKHIGAIVKREFRAWFDHPMGYLLVIVALVFQAFFYFQSLVANPVASLRAMFDLLPWLVIFLAPALTMRLIAEERKEGILDAILAQPINPWVYLAGKLMAGWLFFLTIFASTLLIPLTLAPYGAFDGGAVAAQYIGAALLSLALTAVGLAASSATRHQVTAFLTGIAAGFVLLIAGFGVVTATLPGSLRFIAEQLSIYGHYQNVTRGVLDARDLIYFLTLTAGAFSLAGWSVMKERLSPHQGRRRRLSIGAVLLVAVFIGLNLLSTMIRGRIDFTGNKLYTLSPGAATVLGALPDIVTIKLFSSPELPPQVALVKRDVDDLLADIKSRGRGNVRIEGIAVNEGTPQADEARALGIAPVQFNVYKKEAFQAQAGMFGISIEYAGSHESIPYIDRSDDLEYRILRAIRTLTKSEKHTVAFATGQGERTPEETSNLREAVQGLFEIKEVDLAATSTPAGIDADVVVLAGTSQPLTEQARQQLFKFINGGGAVLALIDPVEVQPQTLSATARDASIGGLFRDYGVSVAPQLLADLQSHETVSMQSGFLSVFLPYPYWIKASVVHENPIAGSLPTTVLPWASPIEKVAGTEGVEINDLLTTTEAGIIKTPPFSIDPKTQISVQSESELGKRTMAVSILVTQRDGAPLAKQGRIVLVGDADMVADQFMGEGSPNLAFALNALDWLTQDEALIGIRSKSRIPPPLNFPTESGRLRQIRYLVMIGLPAVIALVAAVRLFIRRKKSV